MPSSTQNPQKIYSLRENESPASPEPFYQNYKEGVPIALDLGSSSFKIGLTNSTSPNNVFPTLISRFRDRKANKSLTIIGNDIYRDSSIKSSTKSPFDGPLITNWDYVEDILDYSFEHLSVTSSNGKVNNPIIMTEPPCVPFSQRKNYYELFFETYQVPKITFGIDSLFSHYANTDNYNPKTANSLVIGTGHESTHIIPVVDGRGLLSQAKRIDWGGSQSSQYCSKLLSMKYPYFPSKLNSNHATNIVQDHCYVSNDFQEELKNYLDMENLEKNDVVLQATNELNSGAASSNAANAESKKKSEEELKRQAEKRREQGKRLQLQAQQKRLEKLIQKEQEWEYYSNLKLEFESMNKQQIQARCVQEEFESVEDFNKYVANLDKSLKKARNEDVGDGEEGGDGHSGQWTLVDIPDDQLNEEQIKEKRKQRLMKANFDARERAKQAKAEEEELLRKFEEEQAEWRARDLEDWCAVKKSELADIITKITEKAKLLESFKDRKSMAAQQRMRNIATLANDENGSTSATSRKRRRNANSTIDNDPNDTFGTNDDDWNAYRDITNASLEEQLEEDNQAVLKIEAELLLYDPTFHHEDTFNASQKFDWENSTLHKFIHGPRENILVKLQTESSQKNDGKLLEPEELENHPEVVQRNHQMHFNIERIRIPEILFQPNIAGLDQAGIVEISENLLYHRLDGNFQPGGQSYNLIQDVFLAGGLVKWPNFESRIINEFTSFLPVGAPLKVRRAKDPIVDAWKGMQKWSQTEECENSYVTQAEYDEMGPEYIKEHGLGNVCLK
ncbi:actin-related protein 5 [[Candida] railenensis]|uniref:Actin-related protein 5 n=1 Tax=[Candida] railenensis TaxID=45579 RepID=A0A9P0QKR3_9ASCO|nr:actin-related protein 5 [[Candida] railenensis]